MNLLKVDFLELYRRHLCRHSEFGINVLHLIAVAGIYFSLFGIGFALPGGPWIVGTVLTVYFALLAANIPLRLWITTVLAIALLLLAFLAVPRVNVLVYVLMIFVWHRFQVWHHRVFHKSHPMDDFSEKYQKGPLLFVLLAVYELPILLNFLVFDRRNWGTHPAGEPAAEIHSSEPAKETVVSPE